MAEVPQNGKPISDFDAGTLTASSLFYLSYPSAAGMSSGKISAAELGEGMGDNVEFEGLNSSDKTLFGAINEALAVSTENAVLITETFDPGSTGAVITDDRIKEDSIIDVYTNKYGVVPESVSAGNGRVTITMPQHSDTIVVALLLRGVSEGGNDMHDYSETEQKIGTWIDGSDLYERTFEFTTPPSGNNWSTYQLSTGIEVKQYAVYLVRTNDKIDAFSAWAASTQYLVANVSGTDLNLFVSSVFIPDFVKIVAIVQYTKP